MRILISTLLYVWVTVHFIVIAIPFLVLNITLRLIGRRPWYKSIPFLGNYMLFIHGLKVTTSGSLPREGNYVIIANHGSYLDIFLLAKAMNGKPCSACAAHQVIRTPVLGWIFRSFYTVPIFRHDSERAREGIREATRIMDEIGCYMIIMAEGTRTVTCELLPFKKGFAYLAQGAGRDIVPLYFTGVCEAKPKNRFAFRWTKINIHIGEPISISKYNTPQELHAAVEAIYKKEFERQRQLHPAYSQE